MYVCGVGTGSFGPRARTVISVISKDVRLDKERRHRSSIKHRSVSKANCLPLEATFLADIEFM